MSQLSLKKVLAYLDDTLEPRALREVSEAIAQSKELQELVARIQRVTRRRSLVSESEREEETLSATVLAQYLEGTLPSEEAAELEEQCLRDDTLLAEVATCHQLLYGGTQLDPSRTPPSAYRRMYGLLEGVESQVGPAALSRPSSTLEEAPALRPEEQAWLLGLPMVARGPWSRRIVPLSVIVVLLLGLIVSLYFAISRRALPTTSPTELARVTPLESATNAKPVEPPVVQPKTPPGFTPDAQQSRRLSGWLMLLPMFLSQGSVYPGCLATSLVGELPLEGATVAPPRENVPTPKPTEEIVAPPGTERLPQELMPREVSELLSSVAPAVSDGRELGTSTVFGVADTLFWLWNTDGQSARLLRPQERLFSGQRLQVWPGYRAAFRLNSGVQVELVGNIPEIHPEPTLDTVCQLFTPQPPYHADLRLERGWFVFTGRKEGETRLRLRVAKETWDIYLPPGPQRLLVSVNWRLQRGQTPLRAELHRELWTLESGMLWRRTVPEGASQTLSIFSYSCVLADVDDLELPQRGPVVVPAPRPAAWLDKLAKLPAALQGELREFQRAVHQRSAVENPTQPLAGARQALNEQLDSSQPVQVRLAVFALAASNQLDELVRILDSRQQLEIRSAAREALHYWLGQYPDRADQLSQVAGRQRGYTPDEAGLLVELLRGYTTPGRQVAERLLEIMLHPTKAGLRYLAWANFRELFPSIKDNYSPDASREAREKAIGGIRAQLR